jgi:adenine-specific DNA-methyltransferase
MAAFDQLQLELSLEINEAMTTTGRKLLENFDDEVREKLRLRDESSRAFLNSFERLLMQVTEHELAGCAEFLNDSAFRLNSLPFAVRDGEVPLGLYELPRRSGESHLYRLNHPLAEAVIDQAKRRDLLTAEVRFDYSGRTGKVSLLEPLIGKSGWLSLTRLSVEALDQAEDHLILAGMTDLGAVLDSQVAARLLRLPGTLAAEQVASDSITAALSGQATERQTAIQRGVSERNAQFFSAEADKLDGWADDLKLGLEREIKELDRQVREARRATTAALTLEEKLAGQKQIRTLESQRNEKRRSLFDAQDRVDTQRDALIAKIEGKLGQKVTNEPLFLIRWTLQ